VRHEQQQQQTRFSQTRCFGRCETAVRIPYLSQSGPPTRYMHRHLAFTQFVHAFPYGAGVPSARTLTRASMAMSLSSEMYRGLGSQLQRSPIDL
jgi:hypothetical protein